MSDSVTITESAAEKLKGILAAENEPDKGLRIRVVPGGCSGYSYDMVVDKAGENDQTFVSNGLKLVVDDESINLLKGAEIDFQESFGNSGFTIKNPNSTGGCGCVRRPRYSISNSNSIGSRLPSSTHIRRVPGMNESGAIFL